MHGINEKQYENYFILFFWNVSKYQKQNIWPNCGPRVACSMLFACKFWGTNMKHSCMKMLLPEADVMDRL